MNTNGSISLNNDFERRRMSSFFKQIKKFENEDYIIPKISETQEIDNFTDIEQIDILPLECKKIEFKAIPILSKINQYPSKVDNLNTDVAHV
jgi:hypothetical protein